MPITTRLLEIEPFGTEEEITKVKEKLNKINDALYIVANLAVSNCFNEYWTKPLEKIVYLQDQKRVDEIEVKIVSAIQELHQPHVSDTEKEKLKGNITELKMQKDDIIRHEQKRKLAQECENGSILKSLKVTFHQVPENILLQILLRVTQPFLKELENLRQGKRKFPYYTKGIPIPFGFENNYEPFFVKDGSKDIYFKWIEGVEFKLLFGRDRSKNQELIQRFLFNELNSNKNIGDSSIKLDRYRERFYLQLVIKEPPIKPQTANKDLAMGIDLGYNIPAYWALSDFSDAGEIGNGESIKNIRTEFSKRLSEISESLRSAQGGHGQKRKLKTLRSTLRKKERDYFTNLNREMAKMIIEIATKKGVGIIRLEKLDFGETRTKMAEGARNLNINLTKAKVTKTYASRQDHLLRMFQFWSYSQFLRFIQQKADKLGIEIVFVNPPNTSRKCHRCGRQGYRPGNKKFLVFDTKCEKVFCPLEENKIGKKREKKWTIIADRNAAFNIATWTSIAPKVS